MRGQRPRRRPRPRKERHHRGHQSLRGCPQLQGPRQLDREAILTQRNPSDRDPPKTLPRSFPKSNLAVLALAPTHPNHRCTTPTLTPNHRNLIPLPPRLQPLIHQSSTSARRPSINPRQPRPWHPSPRNCPRAPWLSLAWVCPSPPCQQASDQRPIASRALIQQSEPTPHLLARPWQTRWSGREVGTGAWIESHRLGRYNQRGKGHGPEVWRWMTGRELKEGRRLRRRVRRGWVHRRHCPQSLRRERRRSRWSRRREWLANVLPLLKRPKSIMR